MGFEERMQRKVTATLMSASFVRYVAEVIVLQIEELHYSRNVESILQEKFCDAWRRILTLILTSGVISAHPAATSTKFLNLPDHRSVRIVEGVSSTRLATIMAISLISLRT